MSAILTWHEAHDDENAEVDENVDENASVRIRLG